MSIPDAVELLCLTTMVGLGSTGLTIILRNAPVVRGWVQEAKKPWACNICMPLYTVGAQLAALHWLDNTGHWLVYLPSYAVSYVALEKLAEPAGPPPEFPDLPVEDE